MKMTPKGLEQSPQKPFNHKPPQDIQSTQTQPINDSVHLLDSVRLIISKKLENTAFAAFQESKGVTVTGAAVGGGFLANINWIQLFAGDVTEIIKLVLSLIGFAVTIFTKK